MESGLSVEVPATSPADMLHRRSVRLRGALIAVILNSCSEASTVLSWEPVLWLHVLAIGHYSSSVFICCIPLSILSCLRVGKQFSDVWSKLQVGASEVGRFSALKGSFHRFIFLWTLSRIDIQLKDSRLPQPKHVLERHLYARTWGVFHLFSILSVGFSLRVAFNLLHLCMPSLLSESFPENALAGAV